MIRWKGLLSTSEPRRHMQLWQQGVYFLCPHFNCLTDWFCFVFHCAKSLLKCVSFLFFLKLWSYDILERTFPVFQLPVNQLTYQAVKSVALMFNAFVFLYQNQSCIAFCFALFL